MIIPRTDFKLSSFKTRDLCKPIHILSNTVLEKNACHLNTHVFTKKLLLSSHVDRDYVIAFDVVYNTKDLVRFQSEHCNVTTASIGDVLEYCGCNGSALLIVTGKNRYMRMDPHSCVSSIHHIEL